LKADLSKKALVIGVSEYNNSNITELEFCKNDGQKMEEVLKSIHYEIPENNSLVGFVKFEQMRDAIYDFFDKSKSRVDDVLILYYSGHGVPDSEGDIYLSTSEIDPDTPYRRGFSFNEFTKMISNSPSTRIVVILDCCYSGAAKISKGVEDSAATIATATINEKSSHLQNNKGICLLAASQAAQEKYALKEGGNSIFTYHLLDGLKGKAVDANGNVTADSLGKYVHRAIVNLPYDKRPKQTPVRKMEVGDEIILAHYSRSTEPKDSKCFFIAPCNDESVEGHGEHSIEVFEKIIRPITEELGYETIRGDNINESSLMIQKLFESVSNDEFVIADLTSNDPNVLYLLGLCHALRKHVIKIRDSSSASHSCDLPGIHPIDYDLNVEPKLEECRKEITKQIRLVEIRGMSSVLNLPPRIEMVNGEREILEFLENHKRQTKDEYWGMWITNEYDRSSILEYYEEEMKLGISSVTRLVNTKVVDRDLIKKHIMMFKENILSGNYAIFSTNHSSYEITYCKKDKRNVMAGMLYPDNVNNRVDLAVYSLDPFFVDQLKTRYRDLQRQGERFRMIENDEERSIDEWIDNTIKG
jgi:Caspase domain